MTKFLQKKKKKNYIYNLTFLNANDQSIQNVSLRISESVALAEMSQEHIWGKYEKIKIN